MSLTSNDWLVCNDSHTLLSQLEQRLEASVSSDDAHLTELALYLVRLGGKRLRPALLIVAAQFGSAAPDHLLTAAAAIELLHVASLYHDDVADRAPLRRGTESANQRWGNVVAGLVGTYLFARATDLLASLGDVPNQMASLSSSVVCSGQLQELENAYNLDLTEDEHLTILTYKTAALFELPCRLGAYLSGADDAHAAALGSYGRLMGLAFQLTDDTFDLFGQTAQIGKATGNDLRQGTYSLPVLRALRHNGTAGQHLYAVLRKARLSNGDIDTALDIIHRSGTISETLSIARTYASRATAELDSLPPGPAHNSLTRLADYAISRTT
ncbi:MAG: polyprenyl synthetase family protein [Chloroflexi bacterium]|nr:polyprenyl synthetase family protein [Chloroflexota bacterium]